MKLTLFLLSICVAYTFAKKVCEHKIDADVVFLLDMSLSTSNAQFKQEKDFCINLLKQIGPMGKNGVRASVISFSSSNDIFLNVKLNEAKNVEQFTKLIDKIQKKGYMTYTGMAMEIVKKEAFSAKNGGRKDAKKLIFLLTDGAPSDNVRASEFAKYFREHKEILYGVGIRESGIHAVEKLAYDKNYVMQVNNYDGLDSDSLVSKITKMICEDTKPPKPKQEACMRVTGTDLIFVIDSSWSVTFGSGFKNEIATVREIIMALVKSGIKYGSTGDEFQIGVVEFGGTEGKLVLKLNQSPSFAQAVQQVLKIQPMKNAFQSPITAGLKTALKEGLSAKNGARKTARRIVVELTDGRGSSRTRMSDEMKIYTKENIASVAISPETWECPGLRILGTSGYYTKNEFKEAMSKIIELAKTKCFDDSIYKIKKN